MAGRQLQRQREAALANLSNHQVSELARTLVPKLRAPVVRNLLMSAGDVRTALAAAGDPRAALAAIVAHDPTTARLAVSLCWHEQDVEQALGITRTPSQARS